MKLCKHIAQYYKKDGSKPRVAGFEEAYCVKCNRQWIFNKKKRKWIEQIDIQDKASNMLASLFLKPSVKPVFIRNEFMWSDQEKLVKRVSNQSVDTSIIEVSDMPFSDFGIAKIGFQTVGYKVVYRRPSLKEFILGLFRFRIYTKIRTNSLVITKLK